jgi:hypothetical protein
MIDIEHIIWSTLTMIRSTGDTALTASAWAITQFLGSSRHADSITMTRGLSTLRLRMFVVLAMAALVVARTTFKVGLCMLTSVGATMHKCGSHFRAGTMREGRYLHLLYARPEKVIDCDPSIPRAAPSLRVGNQLRYPRRSVARHSARLAVGSYDDP